MSDGNRCKSCRWYRPTIADGGECRRRSPGVVAKHDAVWPWVHGVDYCGDWTSAEPSGQTGQLQPLSPAEQLPHASRGQLNNLGGGR